MTVTIKLQRIGLPRVPQLKRGIHKLIGAAITIGMHRHTFIVMVTCFDIKHRGDHVPAHAPTRNMIQRGHHSRSMKRRIKSAGNGTDKADFFGGTTHRGHGR